MGFLQVVEAGGQSLVEEADSEKVRSALLVVEFELSIAIAFGPRVEKSA
jgi:hypothetical protein